MTILIQLRKWCFISSLLRIFKFRNGCCMLYNASPENIIWLFSFNLINYMRFLMLNHHSWNKLYFIVVWILFITTLWDLISYTQFCVCHKVIVRTEFLTSFKSTVCLGFWHQGYASFVEKTGKFSSFGGILCFPGFGCPISLPSSFQRCSKVPPIIVPPTIHEDVLSQ